MEEFLDLLRRREEGRVGLRTGPDAGHSVFVSRTLRRRASRFGHPLVARFVVAVFVHDETLVYYGRTTSNAVELPEMVARTEDRQREACEGVRAEIERRLENRGLNVPVHEGPPRHPVDDGRGR